MFVMIGSSQLGLFADHTSCHYFVVNQFRLLLASVAQLGRRHRSFRVYQPLPAV